MSEPRTDGLTRQPRGPSAGGETVPEHEGDDQLSPEEALAQAKEALATSETEAKRARDEAASAQRERDQALSRERTATAETISSRERNIISGIESQKAAADQAKRDIAIAQAAGDAVAVADAFDKLADARSKLGRLTDQKEWFDAERERIKTLPAQQEGQPTATGFQVSTPGGQIRVTDAAKGWMDKHTRFYNDTAYYNHAVGAHATITHDGVQEGSPAYFRALDDAMTKFEEYEAWQRGDRTKEVNTPMDRMRRQQESRTPASSMAAPVSRGTVNPGSGRGEPDALAIAKHLGVTVPDLREAAVWNGMKGEDGFKKYLASQQEIIDIQRNGGDAGLRVDGVYR